MTKLVIGIIIAVVLIFVGIWYFDRPEPEAVVSLDSFAQCLADKGATMYGTYNCSHCGNEKRAFSDSFKYIPYIECTVEPERCLEEGINAVPAWVFPDGRHLVGEQGLQKLSQESGCPLPGKVENGSVNGKTPLVLPPS